MVHRSHLEQMYFNLIGLLDSTPRCPLVPRPECGNTCFLLAELAACLVLSVFLSGRVCRG